MRRLTKSERRLSWALGIAVFAVLNFYGLSYLFDTHTALAGKLRDLRGQREANALWLRERDLWLARKTWLDAKQPRVPASGAPQSDLLETLTASAKSNGLTIDEQGFGEPKNTPDYRGVAVKLKLTGKLENMVKWLVAVQQPEQFQAITSFTLKSASEPPTVTLELEVARWYAPHV